MSERIPQVNQLIKKELSQIILKEVEFPSGVFVTVTRVETAVNLNQAKVYISIMFTLHRNKVSDAGSENKIKVALQILNQQIYELQQKLNQRLRMRPIPRIKFLEEKETSEAGKIEEVLEKLKNKE